MANLMAMLAQRGQVTIPKPLRDRHRWEMGQQFTLLDLDGVVVMSPKESQIDALANQLRDDLVQEPQNNSPSRKFMLRSLEDKAGV